MMTSMSYPTWLATLAVFCFLLLTGCGPPGMQRVSGTVTFAGGMPPQSEIAVVRFEPVAGSTHPDQFKVASGTINPDGSYKLTTLDPDDGAYIGEYKVTFTIHKTYRGQESQIEPQFTKAATTPFTVKVDGGKSKFDFELTKSPGF
jgi:hypothetical protein